MLAKLHSDDRRCLLSTLARWLCVCLEKRSTSNSHLGCCWPFRQGEEALASPPLGQNALAMPLLLARVLMVYARSAPRSFARTTALGEEGSSGLGLRMQTNEITLLRKNLDFHG